MSITQANSTLIEANNISFTYQGNVVLDNVSFKINKGDYVGIIGPNGGGKTTLIKILVKLLEPDSGSFTIVNESGSFKSNIIGYVPQRISADSMSFPATVEEIVESGRIVKKGTIGSLDNQDRVAIDSALQSAGILDLKYRLMSRLSGGQRQRVYVARALAAEPSILILDEPFVGVDIATQKEFYQLLKELNNNRNLTIIFVSHDIDVVTEEAKSILCLNKKLLSFGPAKDLEEQKVIEGMYGKRITHLHHIL